MVGCCLVAVCCFVVAWLVCWVVGWLVVSVFLLLSWDVGPPCTKVVAAIFISCLAEI